MWHISCILDDAERVVIDDAERVVTICYDLLVQIEYLVSSCVVVDAEPCSALHYTILGHAVHCIIPYGAM